MRRTLTALLVLTVMFTLTPFTRTHAAPSTITTNAVFQQYDSGFMIWRSDTGAILVFANSSELYPYASTMYGNLPDNPIRQATPYAHYRPRLGFGKVWGNFPAVRAALGWPTALEVGYTLQISYTSVDTIYTMTLPDHRMITVYFNNHWQNSTVLQPISAYAAFQAFDNGYMIWRADNQEVTVFYGKTRGTLQGYALGTYDYLPDNPVTDSPPAGHVRPINAFGRIWGHDAQVRQQLGWPISAEQGYTFTGQALQDGQFNMSAADGRVFNIYGVNWTF